MNLKLEYEQDFQQWIEHHIALLKAGRFNEIDTEHLLEELADMGKGNLHELDSRFTILIAHLLKWEYQFLQLQERWGDFAGHSWKSTIIEQRVQIIKLLRKNPSLKRFLLEVIIESYPDALKIAVKETDLPASAFPSECPYSIEQLLDEDFFPSERTGHK